MGRSRWFSSALLARCDLPLAVEFTYREIHPINNRLAVAIAIWVAVLSNPNQRVHNKQASFKHPAAKRGLALKLARVTQYRINMDEQTCRTSHLSA